MADKDFQLRIITPERVFYEGTVDMVEFNTTEGQIGVLPGHIPLTVIVKPGILHRQYGLIIEVISSLKNIIKNQ